MLKSPFISPLSPIMSAVLGARRTYGAAVIPDPTTVSFSSAQFATGFAGSRSTTKTAGRIYGRAGLTVWCGIITGSEAKLSITSAWGANPGVVQVAINGGSFADAPNTGALYTLFTGQPHAAYFVEVRYGSGYGEEGYILSTGNVLAVTGQPPALSTIHDWLEIGADTSLGLMSCASAANSTNFTPLMQAAKGNTYGSNVGSAKLRGAFTKIYAAVNGNTRKVGVSKNGSAPTYYTIAEESGQPYRAIVIPCDGSVSTYNVWDDGNGKTNGGHFSVAGDSALLDIGVRRRLDQFGDSITYGAGSDGLNATPASVDTMYVAAAIGFTGSTNGISGYTIAQCKTLIDAVLPNKVVTSSDVAVLAVGRNNVGAVDAAAQTDYGLCIDKLLAKGYGKILCRAILPTPSGSSVWTAENSALESVVTAKANPNVVWIPTSTWLGYGSVDNTHPTEAGYAVLAGYAIPAYSAALGIT